MLLQEEYYYHIKYLIEIYNTQLIENFDDIYNKEILRLLPYSNDHNYSTFLQNILNYYFNIFYNIPVYTKRNGIPLNKYLILNYNIELKNPECVTDYDLINYIVTNDITIKKYYLQYIKKQENSIDILTESLDKLLFS